MALLLKYPGQNECNYFYFLKIIKFVIIVLWKFLCRSNLHLCSLSLQEKYLFIIIATMTEYRHSIDYRKTNLEIFMLAAHFILLIHKKSVKSIPIISNPFRKFKNEEYIHPKKQLASIYACISKAQAIMVALCLGRAGWLWFYEGNLQHNPPPYYWEGRWQRSGQFASIIDSLFPLFSCRGRNQFSYPSSLSQMPQWIFRIQNWEIFLILIYLLKFLLSEQAIYLWR